MAARGTDAVVLAGGDGSHMGGISALARAYGGAPPPLALAPGGTVCTVARNLGMHGGAAAWVERVVAAACREDRRVEAHATLRVRDAAGGDRVGFIFGAGLVARFFDEYYGASAQGLAPAAGIAARVFAGSLVGSALARRVLAPAKCSVEIDGTIADDARVESAPRERRARRGPPRARDLPRGPGARPVPRRRQRASAARARVRGAARALRACAAGRAAQSTFWPRRCASSFDERGRTCSTGT